MWSIDMINIVLPVIMPLDSENVTISASVRQWYISEIREGFESKIFVFINFSHEFYFSF